ncbi:hypothetical protein [Comamonas sp.]|uniref:hypothetical protein n=1 Tax=Comamonas sp. TaxID=34028 RepID=UPI0028986CC4|nr:hypothetical protein [Comamonas sp.]
MSNIVKNGAIPSKMSTKEIAKATGKNHGHVLRDTRVMLVTLFGASYIDSVIPADKAGQRGQFIWDNADTLFRAIFLNDAVLDHQLNQGFTLHWDSRGYLSLVDLDRNLTLTLASGYDIVLRNRVVLRLDELEKKIAGQAKTAYVTGKSDSLTAEEQTELRDMLTCAADSLPKGERGSFMQRGWSKLKAHFKVSYRDIPRAEFTEAIAIASRHIAEYEKPLALPVLPAPSATDKALLQAMDSVQVMAECMADLSAAVLSLSGQRQRMKVNSTTPEAAGATA